MPHGAVPPGITDSLTREGLQASAGVNGLTTNRSYYANMHVTYLHMYIVYDPNGFSDLVS